MTLRKIPSIALISIAFLSLLGCGGGKPNPSFGKAKLVATDGPVPERTQLDQNWDQQTRVDFWYASQGARFFPYAWFTWLEQADNEILFRHTDNLSRLGYIPDYSSKDNLAGLPIGFALDTDKITGDDWLGFTCAACHTAEVDVGDTKILIEGGPTMGNMMKFFKELLAATQATYDDQTKFQRFAGNVLGSGPESATNGDLESKQLGLLKEALLDQITFFKNYLDINLVPSSYPDDFSGYARTDAFGIIQNMATAFSLGKLSNTNVANAPVSYPFLWGAHQSNVVQWNGALPNGVYGLGPLMRNTGEVVGVFGGLTIQKAPIWQRLFRNHRYDGHIEVSNLGDIESWLRDLRSPKWPEDALPAIDQTMVAAGEEVYREKAGCVGCHALVAREDEDKLYNATLIPAKHVGTDDVMTKNALDHEAYTFLLEGTRKQVVAGEKFAETAPATEFAFNGTFGLLLKEPIVAARAAWKSRQIDPDALEANTETREFSEADAKHYLGDSIQAYADAVQAGSKCGATDHPLHTDALNETDKAYCYKARPLTGIWATAPYLHNGSVPTLRDMLRDPEDRPTEFWVGSRQYDPLNVGFVSAQIGTGEAQSKFNVYKSDGVTIQPGNSNQGHKYASGLNEEEKNQLLEFLKTL